VVYIPRLTPMAVFFLLACETVAVGPPAPGASPSSDLVPSGQPAAALPSDDPGDAPCDTLDRATCMRSVVCTLAAPSGGSSERYVCRPATGNCEFGLGQLAEHEDRCVARTGCRWRDAPCYCACRGAGQTSVEDEPETPVCECGCRGGPPPGCMPRG